jgi:glycosyltransferase involved in cell wall biosynthesis
MNRNVLIITSIYPPQIGGPAIFASRFTSWLTSLSLSTQTLTYAEFYSKQKSSVTEVKLGRIRIYSFFNFISKIISKSNGNTVILANGAFLETYFACLLTRREYIVKIPGDPVWELSRNRKWTNLNRVDFQTEKLGIRITLLRFLYNKAFRKAKFVICPSEELVDFSINWGVNKNQIKLVYNCVNSTDFLNLTNNLKKYDLVTVSRLVNGKGLEELIECASTLNLKLAIVGDGPLMNELKSLATTCNSDVDFLGNVMNQRVSLILNDSKIFILNSESEATSYAIIEAKMCGLPIVARKNAGSLTMVRDRIDGLIYSAESGDKLIDSVVKMYSNQNLMKQFGDKGREDALKRFNEEINFRNILDLLAR